MAEGCLTAAESLETVVGYVCRPIEGALPAPPFVFVLLTNAAELLECSGLTPGQAAADSEGDCGIALVVTD